MSEPSITAPVSRWLGARDVQRTVAFWRDVLGFEVSGHSEDGGIEVRSGRARIHFGELDAAPDLSKEGPPGSAIVFFDTDDVAAMQAAVRRRGGQTSDLEKVNWIMRTVFEVRDPDGHVISSYAGVPTCRASRSVSHGGSASSKCWNHPATG